MNIDYSEIESIEFIGEMNTIDICVEEEHMFFANDIYTHNSGFSEDINGIKSIGKAIEIFQVADMLVTFSQSPEQEERQECIAMLLKNRHGKKNICLLCHYDPNKGIFIEKEIMNPIVFLNTKAKTRVLNSIENARQKLNEKISTGIKKQP